MANEPGQQAAVPASGKLALSLEDIIKQSRTPRDAKNASGRNGDGKNAAKRGHTNVDKRGNSNAARRGPMSVEKRGHATGEKHGRHNAQLQGSGSAFRLDRSPATGGNSASRRRRDKARSIDAGRGQPAARRSGPSDVRRAPKATSRAPLTVTIVNERAENRGFTRRDDRGRHGNDRRTNDRRRF